MHIVAIGLSHKTTPVEIREKVSFPESKLKDALDNLKKYSNIIETIILSTCNRVEIYSVVKDIEYGIKDVKSFIANYHCVNSAELEKCLYIHSEERAIEHLFRVICSLESMIVGEPQIFGQIKEAYQNSFENKTTGIIFNTLFKNAISVGKRARTETDIAKSAVSISFAAVELAKKIFDSIEGKTVMIIGAGKMSELTAKHLVSNGVTKVIIANRTYERACDMAKIFNGMPIRFSDILDHIVGVDIVISSTGSPNFVIGCDEAQKIIKVRKNKPIFFIDIAVPRDIDPKVNEIDNVFLYDIDDLKEVVNANIQERSREIPKVENIILHEKSMFLKWFTTREMVPTITLLSKQFEDIRQKELEKIMPKLKNLDQNEINLVNAMSKAIINKILHKPIIKLKKLSGEENGVLYNEVISELFELKEDDIIKNETEKSDTDVAFNNNEAELKREI